MKKYILLLVLIIVSCNHKNEEIALSIINDLISQPESIINIKQKIQLSDFLVNSINQNSNSYINLLTKFKNYKVEGIYYSGKDNQDFTIEIVDESGVWNLRFYFERNKDGLILKRLEADELMKGYSATPWFVLYRKVAI